MFSIVSFSSPFIFFLNSVNKGCCCCCCQCKIGTFDNVPRHSKRRFETGQLNFRANKCQHFYSIINHEKRGKMYLSQDCPYVSSREAPAHLPNIKASANARNNTQHCWAQQCCLLLRDVSRCVQTLATSRNMLGL